jgi:molybdopterin synthase catalytic subunit
MIYGNPFKQMKTRIEFTRAPIVVPPMPAALRETGACVEFQGIVRELENGRKIPALFYEAYEAMARPQLERIISELNGAHPCDEIILILRLGLVPVGEASFYLRVLARHRQEAFQFAAELVTRMKGEVTIWKTVPPAVRLKKDLEAANTKG